MVKKIEKIPVEKFLFSTVWGFIVAQISNFTKNDLFSRNFAKILARNTEQLFRRILFDD